MNTTPVSAIAVISAGKRALGLENKLLWHLPEDLERFKALTLHNPVIMGRKTFESIVTYLGKPLPNRTNIILTRSSQEIHPDVVTAASIEDAITYAQSLDSKEIFIIGGAEIYQLAMPLVDKLYLTVVADEPQADSFFPAYEQLFTAVKKSATKTCAGTDYTFVDLMRNS